jgi:hypothetical protein
LAISIAIASVGTDRQRELRRPCGLHRDAAALEGADDEFEPGAIDGRHQPLPVAAQARTERERAGLRILQQQVFDDVGQRLLQSRARQRRHRHVQQVDVARIEDQRGRLQHRQGIQAHAHVARRAGAAEHGHRLAAEVGAAAHLVRDGHGQHREQHRLGGEGTLADRARRQPDDRLAFPQYLCCHMSSTRLAPRYRSASLCDSTRPKRTTPLTKKKSEPTDSRLAGSTGDPSNRERATSRLAK